MSAKNPKVGEDIRLKETITNTFYKGRHGIIIKVHDGVFTTAFPKILGQGYDYILLSRKKFVIPRKKVPLAVKPFNGPMYQKSKPNAQFKYDDTEII